MDFFSTYKQSTSFCFRSRGHHNGHIGRNKTDHEDMLTLVLCFLGCSLASIGGAEGRSGSTGTIAFVRKDMVVVAYVGDSRAVSLRQQGSADISLNPLTPLLSVCPHRTRLIACTEPLHNFEAYESLLSAHANPCSTLLCRLQDVLRRCVCWLLIRAALQVLCRGKSAVDLSGDHRPWGKAASAVAELKRLKEAGCWVRSAPRDSNSNPVRWGA